MASVCSSFPPSPLFLAAWCRDGKYFMCLERASRTLHPFPRDQGVVPWILLTFLEDRSDICSLPVLRNYPNCLNFPEVMEWTCGGVGQVPQHSQNPIKSQASSTWYSHLISSSGTGWALPRSDEIHRAAARKATVDGQVYTVTHVLTLKPQSTGPDQPRNAAKLGTRSW